MGWSDNDAKGVETVIGREEEPARHGSAAIADSGLLGAFLIQRDNVRSEISNRSIFNSPRIRGAPQAGFSATNRKISSRNSLLTHFLPARVRCRESHFQYSLKPTRCQPTTVSGRTRISALCHRGQKRRSTTQRYRSALENRGRGRCRARTDSCCRKANFSRRR